jgi:hypothetical protein
MARPSIVRLGRRTAGLMLYGALVAPHSWAATKELEKPDREMLRMMELLKEMEMLQQIDMMRDMHEADHAGTAPRDTPKTPPPKNKGAQK